MAMSIFIIWMSPFQSKGFLVNVLTFIVFCKEIQISKLALYFVVSELGMHCLHMSQKGISSLKWVKWATVQTNIRKSYGMRSHDLDQAKNLFYWLSKLSF